MKKIVMILLLLVPGLSVAGTDYEENTLGANKALSNKMVAKLLGDTDAERVLSTPYTGFYKIDGKVKNNKVSFEKVKAKLSFPDASLEPLALGITGLIEFPVYSTGTRIKTRVSAYVVIYKDSLQDVQFKNVVTLQTSVGAEPNAVAMVIIRQKEMSNARNPNMMLANSELAKRDGNQVYYFEVAI